MSRGATVASPDGLIIACGWLGAQGILAPAVTSVPARPAPTAGVPARNVFRYGGVPYR